VIETPATVVDETPSEAEEKFVEFSGEDGVIDAYEVHDIINGIFNKGKYATKIC